MASRRDTPASPLSMRNMITEAYVAQNTLSEAMKKTAKLKPVTSMSQLFSQYRGRSRAMYSGCRKVE